MESTTIIDKKIYPVEKVADIILEKQPERNRDKIIENIGEVLLALDGLGEVYKHYEKSIPGFFEDKDNIRRKSGDILWDYQHHFRYIGKGEIQPIVKEYIKIYRNTISGAQKKLIKTLSMDIEKSRLDVPVTYKIEKPDHSIWPGEIRVT